MTEVEINTKVGLGLLKKLAKIQSYSGEEDAMIDFIKKVINKLGVNYKVDSAGNILITKGVLCEGEYYPCIVAHMDTVFKKNPLYELEVVEELDGSIILRGLEYDKDAVYYAGTGFDDKNGIWIALRLLKELPKVKILFTVQEEIGAIGASKVDMKFFDDVAYVLEGDRRGNSDVITSIFDDICSIEFIKKISPVMVQYGYSENFGMLTDISSLKENGLAVSCINFSVGYYEPHTDKEYCIFEDLVKAYDFAKECINILGYERQDHIQPKIPYYKNDHYNYFEDDYYDYEWNKGNTSKKCTCISDYLIDLSCNECNPTTIRYSGIICSCGEELIEKEHSDYCQFCNKHFIYDYRR